MFVSKEGERYMSGINSTPGLFLSFFPHDVEAIATQPNTAIKEIICFTFLFILRLILSNYAPRFSHFDSAQCDGSIDRAQGDSLFICMKSQMLHHFSTMIQSSIYFLLLFLQSLKIYRLLFLDQDFLLLLLEASNNVNNK